LSPMSAAAADLYGVHPHAMASAAAAGLVPYGASFLHPIGYPGGMPLPHPPLPGTGGSPSPVFGTKSGSAFNATGAAVMAVGGPPPPPRRRRRSSPSSVGPRSDSNSVNSSDSGSDSEEHIDVVKSAFQQVRPNPLLHLGVPPLTTPVETNPSQPESPNSPSNSSSQSRGSKRPRSRSPSPSPDRTTSSTTLITSCPKSPAIRPNHTQHKNVWRPY